MFFYFLGGGEVIRRKTLVFFSWRFTWYMYPLHMPCSIDLSSINVSFWILSDFTCLAQVLRTKVCSLALHLEHSCVEILFGSAEGPNIFFFFLWPRWISYVYGQDGKNFGLRSLCGGRWFGKCHYDLMWPHLIPHFSDKPPDFWNIFRGYSWMYTPTNVPLWEILM